MLHIREAIVVEGRYDKNTLSQVVDTVILETAGFGVFHNTELTALLRRLAEKRGLIILTDSDGAGFVIRNHLKGVLPPAGVKHAYIPDIAGKERRKRVPGKEGKLGVEGMSPSVLEAARTRSTRRTSSRRRCAARGPRSWMERRTLPPIGRLSPRRTSSVWGSPAERIRSSGGGRCSDGWTSRSTWAPMLC